MIFKDKVLDVFNQNGINHKPLNAVQEDVEVQLMHFNSVLHMVNYFKKGACFNLYVHDIIRTEETVQFWGIA